MRGWSWTGLGPSSWRVLLMSQEGSPTLSEGGPPRMRKTSPDEVGGVSGQQGQWGKKMPISES